MAILTIRTNDDEEAVHIANILEQLDFPLQDLDIDYDKDK